MGKKRPRLRTVDKSEPPYPLNQFPSDFALKLGQELVYMHATKETPSLEGKEWEQIFAHCIGAEWKPSNVGLDDIVMGNTAWGAKTVYSSTNDIHNFKKMRLISGRNSPVYSFGEALDPTKNDPNVVGAHVLEIWNERVTAVRERYANLRTVVLVKAKDLSSVIVAEFDTIRYDAELFNFIWNKGGNLEGYDKTSGEKRFVWQPHGSQFTIEEPLPSKNMIVKVRIPDSIDKNTILKAVGFDKNWISIENRNG